MASFLTFCPGEYHIISGRINDIAWDGESQRIIAVGDGRERFGHCITADSGNSVGEISGHSSIINSVSIRQQRPLRAATGSDDSGMVFLNGAPFKFATKVSGIHKGYVYGVAFSPDGNTLVSVGADKRIQLYDGKTGEPTKQIGEGEHKGSIFAVSWAKDSKRFVTASADQTVKIWDVETGDCVKAWRFGEEGSTSVPDQQVGVVWPAGRGDGLIISLNLAGDLNYLVEGSEKPINVIHGHNRSVTALGQSHATRVDTLWTGSFDGRVCSWDISTGTASATNGHANQVVGFTCMPEGTFSVGWDDKLLSMNDGTVLKLGAQPKGVASCDGIVYVATLAGLEIYEGKKAVSNHAIKEFSPTSISVFGKLVAVGGDTVSTLLNNVISTVQLDPSITREMTIRGCNWLILILSRV